MLSGDDDQVVQSLSLFRQGDGGVSVDAFHAIAW